MAPGQGTGFTSVGQYLDANQGTLANETNQINSGIGGQIDAARSAADSVIGADKQNYQQDYTQVPGYKDALDKAIAAKTQSTAIQTHGGLADYFKTGFKDSQPQADFDANLLGGNQFSSLAGRGAGLTDYLNGGLAGVEAPTTPGAPPAPERDPNSPPGEHGTPMDPGDLSNPGGHSRDPRERIPRGH